MFLISDRPTEYGLLRGAIVGLMLVGLGAFTLWDDFIEPIRNTNGAS